MPLQSGASEGTMKANLKEVYNSYKRSGRIGKSKPKSKKAALKQSIAIAYAQQRKSRRGNTKKA